MLDSISFLTICLIAVTCGMFVAIDWITGVRKETEAEKQMRRVRMEDEY